MLDILALEGNGKFVNQMSLIRWKHSCHRLHYVTWESAVEKSRGFFYFIFLKAKMSKRPCKHNFSFVTQLFVRNSCFWSQSRRSTIPPLSSLQKEILSDCPFQLFIYLFKLPFPQSTALSFGSGHFLRDLNVEGTRCTAWPGDVVRGAGGEAGLQAVRAVHADGVWRRAVVRVRQGVQEDVGLRDDPAAEFISPLPLLAQVCVAVARWRVKIIIKNSIWCQVFWFIWRCVMNSALLVKEISIQTFFFVCLAPQISCLSFTYCRQLAELTMSANWIPLKKVWQDRTEIA